MVNTEIRQFRDSIVAITNASPLPIEVKRLVFAEILTEINAESERTIMNEKEQTKKSESENNNK